MKGSAYLAVLGAFVLSGAPAALAQGLPFPTQRSSPAIPAGAVDLDALARRYAPDIYQDIDDSNAAADLILPMDFDGDVDMTNNWENLDGRDYDQLLDQGAVSTWGSATETHVYLGYAWFHPRDWEDGGVKGSVIGLGRKVLGMNSGEHENDLEGILLVISRETGEPELLVTQAHNDFWQYGPEGLWKERGRDDIDGPIRRDPVTGRVQVFVEAKGHGVYGSPKKTDFDPERGDGVLYSLGGSLPKARDGLTIATYGLEDLAPWWRRFQQVPPGERDETFTREGDRSAFSGDTKDDDSANPPWAWKDGDYPEGINRLFFRQPALFTRWMFEPTQDFSTRLEQRSFPLTSPTEAARRAACRAAAGAVDALRRLR